VQSTHAISVRCASSRSFRSDFRWCSSCD
jgi:hypothetical protein